MKYFDVLIEPMKRQQTFGVVCFAAISVFIWATIIHAETDAPRQAPLRVVQSASELDYPPFSVVRDDGSADGFSVELLTEAAEAVNLEVHFEVGPWSDIKADLIAGNLDALPLVAYSAEREKVMDFTAPYLRMHGTIFVRKEEKSIKSKSDLKDKEVIVMRGDTAHEYVVRNHLTDHIILTDNYGQAMEMLSAGKHDAVVVQHMVGLQLLRKLNITNIVSVEKAHESSLNDTVGPLSGFEQKFCIAVKEGDRELQAMLNEGLALVIANGRYDELYDKWFGPILRQPVVDIATLAKYMALVVFPLIALILVSGVWMLKKEVARKTSALKEQVVISEETKRALQSSETHLRTLFNTLPDLIWLKDSEGRYISCNERFERFFGAMEEEIVGKTDYDFLDKELADFFRKNDRIAIDRGEPVRNEEEVVFADDGHRETLETIKTPMYGADDKLVGVLGIGRDITQRKRAMLDLEDSEQRFRALHEASFGGIGVHDKGLILECNKGLSKMTGYRYDELIGMDGLLLISEDTRDLVSQNISAGVETPYEAKGVRKNGEIYPLRLEARQIPYKGKNVRVVEFRDITEIRKAETEKKELESKLRQAHKMEAVGRLAGGVAHDYNNMLSVIIGYTELALEKLQPDNPLYKSLTQIHKASQRSVDVTRQLLAFARKQTVVPKVIDLNTIVKSMHKMLGKLIGEDIDLSWHPDNNLWPVKIDPAQVDQILANLCVNARDAISGVGKVIIETGNRVLDKAYCESHTGFMPGEYVLLSVSDNGAGMDKETVEKIFEPFFTTKGVDQGTGLGLAMVYGIVKQNEGFIDVYSEPAKGTTFQIFLPRHLGDTQDLPLTQVSSPASSQGETVLLVEDEPAILEMTQIILERLGYHCLATDTPKRALALAREYVGKINVLVSDVVMPEMNGRELSEQIQAVYPNIKTIFMSGYTADVIANHGVLEEGMNFIQKPFSPKDLGRKIRAVLDGNE